MMKSDVEFRILVHSFQFPSLFVDANPFDPVAAHI
jgi:hypothetical protein